MQSKKVIYLFDSIGSTGRLLTTNGKKMLVYIDDAYWPIYACYSTLMSPCPLNTVPTGRQPFTLKKEVWK